MRPILAFAILVLSLAPTTAWGHEVEWSPGPMKSDGAHPGITCKAVGHYEGHQYTWNYQMAGDPSQPADSERRWLEGFCDYGGRQAVKGFFRYTEGVEIPDNAIRVTFRHLP